jgi:hypothetical protein
MVAIKLLINWLYRGLSVTHHGNAYKTASQYNHNTKKIPKGCLKPSWAEPHMTHACCVASSTFISAAHWKSREWGPSWSIQQLNGCFNL